MSDEIRRNAVRGVCSWFEAQGCGQFFDSTTVEACLHFEARSAAMAFSSVPVSSLLHDAASHATGYVVLDRTASIFGGRLVKRLVLASSLCDDEGKFVEVLAHELMHVYLHGIRRNMRCAEGLSLNPVEEGLCELAALLCLLEYESADAQQRMPTAVPIQALHLLSGRCAECTRCAGAGPCRGRARSSRDRIHTNESQADVTYQCGTTAVLRAQYALGMPLSPLTKAAGGPTVRFKLEERVARSLARYADWFCEYGCAQEQR